MTIAQLSGLILICLMICLVYLTTRFVAEAHCNGRGVYHIMINAWFRGNKMYKDWIKVNYGYLVCVVVIIGLCSMVLLLIEPFRHNKMFIRPEASIFINVLLWGAIVFRDQWMYKIVGNKS